MHQNGVQCFQTEHAPGHQNEYSDMSSLFYIMSTVNSLHFSCNQRPPKVVQYFGNPAEKSQRQSHVCCVQHHIDIHDLEAAPFRTALAPFDALWSVLQRPL